MDCLSIKIYSTWTFNHMEESQKFNNLTKDVFILLTREIFTLSRNAQDSFLVLQFFKDIKIDLVDLLKR